MEDDNKLFDLFRENEHKLHEFPSNNAWRRLEQRLDAHRRRTRIAMLRPYAMAASLVLLVGMIALITWVSDTMQQERSQGDARFAQLEDLPPASGSDVYAQNLSLRYQYHGAQLDEGDNSKYFRVNQPRQKTLPAQTSAAEPAPPPAEAPAAKMRAVVSDDEIALKPAAEAAPAEEKPFQWLVGTWQSEGQYPEVFEEWTAIDENRLKGVAFTMEGDKKNVLEELEIRNVDGVWTYFTSGGGEVVEPPYELDTILPNQAIFSNASKGPEQQLILERTGAKEFSSNRNYQQAGVRNMKKIRG